MTAARAREDRIAGRTGLRLTDTNKDGSIL